MKRIFNNGRRGLVALVALIAGLALALTGCSINPTEELSDELKAMLTVTDSSLSCTKIVEKAKGEDAVINGIYKLTVEATKPADDRYVTTSPGLPLKGKTSAARDADIELTLCIDPLQGGMFAHWLAHAKVKDARILDLNEWLKPFDIDVDQVSVYVQETYLPNFGKENPTDDDYQAQVVATRAYEEFASKLVTMLNRFQSYDETSAKSTLNYSLVAGGAVAGKVPPLQLNPEQESLKAKRYALTEKDQCEPLLVVGFNFHDKRLEQFKSPNECKKSSKLVTGSGGGGGKTRPGKVLVCINDGGDTKWVPKSEAHKYPLRPNKNGTCSKEGQGGNPGLNEGTDESNTVNNNDGATDSRGVQDNPQEDAEKAKQAAEAAEKAKQEAAEKAAEEADTSSGGGSEDHGTASKPAW